MENIRIWSTETKVCEAVWLEYLLMLCGWQVWRGRLADSSLEKICVKNEEYRYVDILLFDLIDMDFCRKLAAMRREGMVCVSGENWQQIRKPWWESCPQLAMAEASTLKRMMAQLCNLIVRDSNECAGVLRLTSAYVAGENALARGMYTIHELFCSRRIDYREYENKDLLLKATGKIEEWYQDYTTSLQKKAAFCEEFALTHIQNTVNESYIKAHVRGGFDVDVVFRNANYLLKRNSGCEAAWYLKLQALRNCVNYKEWPDEILENFVSKSASEYRGKAYCEIGDISRENPDKIFDRTTEEYFEKADDQNPEGYCGLYKLGYMYGRKGTESSVWLDKAEMKYAKVVRYISQIKPEYRTPQEFEYYYKASYGRIKTQVVKDRMYGRISADKRMEYEEQLIHLIDGIKGFDKLFFWSGFYGAGSEQENALAFMWEKMKHTEALIRRLLKNEVNA